MSMCGGSCRKYDRCAVCRAERRLVGGAVAIMALMVLAHEVRSQPDGVFRQAMPQRSVKSAGADRAAAVSFSLRTLDLSKISAAAYGDWDDARN